jgi:hypothetical protein
MYSRAAAALKRSAAATKATFVAYDEERIGQPAQAGFVSIAEGFSPT